MRTTLLLPLILAACGGDDGGSPDTPDAEPASTAKPIYLNRTGGSFTMGGAEDSRTNTSVVIPAAHEFGPYDTTEPRWAAFVDCMGDIFAPFDVAITDEDPGDVPHVEVVMVADADWPSVIDQDGVGGLSPFGCAVIPSAIVWVNPAQFADDDYAICWTAAQMVGNSQGLDHAFSCPDVMTYLDDCGDTKSFTDEDVACGEFEARACTCGGATQNSFQTLIDAFGAAPN